MKKSEKQEISTRKAWLLILVSLIDDIIILGLIFLAVWYFHIMLPLWVWILIGVALAAFIFVRTWAVLPALRRKKVMGVEAMVGLTGEVVEPLAPGGVVKVHGEYWQAKSVDGDIEIDAEVEIVDIKRLNLEVKRKEP